MFKKSENLPLLQKLEQKIKSKKIRDIIRKHQARQKFLDARFQEISDIEIIGELEKRVREQQNIKLSTYPNQKHIYITGKERNFTFTTYLPIEIKENEK